MLFKKTRKHIPYIIILLAILLNVFARTSLSFADFYVVSIFPRFVGIFARFSSIFPFSVGELMLYAAFLLILILFLGGFACLFRIPIFRKKHREAASKIRKVYQIYAKTCLWLAAIFFLIMTSNCFILYHCAPIHTFYPFGSAQKQSQAGAANEYSLDQLSRLRDFIVTEANQIAMELRRDEKGYVLYDGDMIGKAQEEMRRLGQDYGRLSGYYPRPKPFIFSDFFSQQYMMGYYFPFSLEANYNASMYIVNKPMTICHELAHVKGFIYEDEANFLGYLACAGSEDIFFRYSAYLGVLNYVERDFINLLADDLSVYHEHPPISDLVQRDNIFLTADAWEKVEKNAIFNTDFVRNISSEIVETNLTLNGVSDGALSYGRVVGLLLMYYDGVLY